MRVLYLFFIAIIISLSACQNHTEEIWINADGSALIEKTIDLSSMLSFIEMGALMSQEEQDDNPLSKLLTREQFDTLFVIEDLMKESAKQQGEQYSRYWLREQLVQEADKRDFDADSVWSIMEPVLDMKMRMQMDMKDEILNITSIIPVADINQVSVPDLSSLSDLFQSESSEERGEFGMIDEDMMADMFQMNEYQYSKNLVNIKMARPDGSSDKETEGMGQLLNSIFGDDLKNTLKVHVPGKIKSVNRPDAVIDGNMVTYEIPMDKLQDPEADVDLEIRFKAKRKFRKIVP